MNLICAITFTSALYLFSIPVQAQGLRDYSKMDHTITLTYLRGGTHDPKGVNDYFLKVTQFAVANTKEERLKEIGARKKTEATSQVFADLEILPLAIWTPPEDEKSEAGSIPFYAARISGDTIRESTASMMKSEKLLEQDIAHMVTIDLFERDKKYYVLNEDKFIASTMYFPIPPSAFDGSERTNQNLQISDDKGTMIKLTVSYDHPIQQTKSSPPSADASGTQPNNSNSKR